MADKKITELDELEATPDSGDMLVIVDDPEGTPATKKISFGNLVHARSHAIDSPDDHTSTITEDHLIDADTNGLPDDSGLSVSDVSDAVSKKHAQNTDTALGSGCVAADHGTASVDQVINVCYGTGDPPDASTTTEGALFVKYTA